MSRPCAARHELGFERLDGCGYLAHRLFVLARRLALEEGLGVKPMDEAPPKLAFGRVAVHPRMHAIYPKLVELGLINASRPAEAGGMDLPLTIATAAMAYLMAANGSAAGFAFLTTGAAHLIEAFGDEALKATYMRPMYDGTWTETMALTEPQAGSSLTDVKTTATPTAEGHYLIRGSKTLRG